MAKGVDDLLAIATTARASDLHLVPRRNGLEITWRRDGVLEHLGSWPAELAPNVLSRLKVLAELLTYRTDLPQEGRLRTSPTAIEMRLSTFPTIYGEKGVVRFFMSSGRYESLEQLGLPADIHEQLRQELAETSGCVIFTGPAGSGKTTTAYACLREIQRLFHGGKSLVSLEDPVETELPGVSQTQVLRPAEFTYAMGLRSLMRQDPDVVFVGEIRDHDTAEMVFQASLTGHLVLSTLHAGSAAQGVTRLRDLGVPPYLLKSGLRAVLCQRLLRRRCGCEAGCDKCWHSGFHGRLLISELFRADMLPESVQELEGLPVTALAQRARDAGMKELASAAHFAIEQGHTTLAEVWRVLGHPVEAKISP